MKSTAPLEPIRHADLDPELNALAEVLVQLFGDVRKELGAGLVEWVYVEALSDELGRQVRVGLLVDGRIIIEAKAVAELHAVHFAQSLTYLRVSGRPLRFLVNFCAVPLGTGIHRRVNSSRRD